MVSPSVSLLVCYLVEVLQLLTVQILLRPLISFAPKLVVHPCDGVVLLIPLPNLVVEHHHKLGEVDVVGVPLLESMIESINDSLDTKLVCNRKVHPKGGLRFIANHRHRCIDTGRNLNCYHVLSFNDVILFPLVFHCLPVGADRD